ncbi:MAG: hypothetical protein HFG05_13105 [Oscillibacter sp.]|nr:hypothetical protein [Oscillibacter sp.]
MEYPPLIFGGKFAAVICGSGRVGFSGAHTVASRSRIYPGIAASSVPHDEYNTALFEKQYVIYVCNITVTNNPKVPNRISFSYLLQIKLFDKNFSAFSYTIIGIVFADFFLYLSYMYNSCFPLNRLF